DQQAPPTPVEYRPDRIAGLEVVRGREYLADDHLARVAAVDPAALAQMEVVERRMGVLGDGDEAAGRRLRESRHVERDVEDDARLHGGDSRDALDLPGHRKWRADEVRERVGEAVIG